MAFEITIEIEREPGDVYAFVSDFENAPRWRSTVSASERVSEGPLERGTRVREKTSVFGASSTVTIELTEVVPGRKIAYRSGRIGPIAPKVVFLLESDGEGTLLRFAGDPNPIFPLKPVGWLFDRMAGRVWSENLAVLKELLEGRNEG